MYQMQNPMMIMPFPYMEGNPLLMMPQGVDMNQMPPMAMMGQNPQFIPMNMMPTGNENAGEQKPDNTQQ